MLVDDVHVVTDAQDTLACARWFGRWHDLGRGRITVRLAPPATRRSVARDILRSLGKRLTLPESPGQTVDLWPLVEVWLAAEQVRHVFVLRAHLLDDDALERLLTACEAARAAPWLIVAAPAPPAEMMTVLDQVLLNPWGDSDLRSRIRTFEQTAADEGTPPKRRRVEEPRPWPLLPDDEFWSFRLTCDELLSDADFDRVDAEMLVGRMIALEWIERRASQQRSRTDALVVDELHGLLAGVCASAATPGQKLARLRGAQIALFLAGALVHIPANALSVLATNATAALDRRAATLLRGFASTHLAAAGALALASGQPPRHLQALNIDSLSDDVSQISGHGRLYPIPFYARGLIRAHRVTRGHQGAAASDPLFRAEQDPAQRISVAALQKMLVRVANATGLALNADLAQYGRGADHWPLEDFVSVELLETGRQR